MNCPFCNKAMLVQSPFSYKCSTLNCCLYRLAYSEITNEIKILEYEYWHKTNDINNRYVGIYLSKLMHGLPYLQLNIRINKVNSLPNIYSFHVDGFDIYKIKQVIQDYMDLATKIIENSELE